MRSLTFPFNHTTVIRTEKRYENWPIQIKEWRKKIWKLTNTITLSLLLISREWFISVGGKINIGYDEPIRPTTTEFITKFIPVEFDHYDPSPRLFNDLCIKIPKSLSISNFLLTSFSNSLRQKISLPITSFSTSLCSASSPVNDGRKPEKSPSTEKQHQQ